MALDFTKLDSISAQSAREDFREPLDDVAGNLAIKREKKRYSALEGIQKERELLRKIHLNYQEAFRKSEELRLAIAKGIDTGEAPTSLLLKALECISLLTGDKMTYTQQEKDIVAIYGWGLREPASLELELDAVRARLAMLTRPSLITPQTPPDAQQRIHRAIEAHTALEKRLERELEAERGLV